MQIAEVAVLSPCLWSCEETNPIEDSMQEVVTSGVKHPYSD